MDLTAFENAALPGGYSIVGVQVSSEPLVDALGREAVAQTVIKGKRLLIRLRADLSKRETSISLYHEVLEAVTVASPHPPETVVNFNEGDFEQAARCAHEQFGDATPTTLSRLLQSFDFREE